MCLSPNYNFYFVILTEKFHIFVLFNSFLKHLGIIKLEHALVVHLVDLLLEVDSGNISLDLHGISKDVFMSEWVKSEEELLWLLQGVQLVLSAKSMKVLEHVLCELWISDQLFSRLGTVGPVLELGWVDDSDHDAVVLG